jgi:hypothetical protein
MSGYDPAGLIPSFYELVMMPSYQYIEDPFKTQVAVCVHDYP